ncbi:polysaccharide deacetylase family protein [Neiella marina]|uniref:Polysaccharide deacetylase family protein n=1 Tax=Neiella holothuriorum TaxID=2870530 RepID=A0ABS7EI96_9GAMM|nr:polysaccharide deacetylase family protein [Neiella holothuriorum]MBW8191618.1 polysaccharide deacetylase family protein [Neiella holothuriorum]
MAKHKDVLFVLSVDTEEEWNWSGPFPEAQCSVANVHMLPVFQDHCRKLGIRPTYFTDYAVAANEQAADVLKSVLEPGDSELGAHLHPWCNPPFYGPTLEFESHVVNLPEEQVAAKLDALLVKLTTVFERQPKSFRTGRWGVDEKTLRLLASRGVDVDSSVYPFYKNDFFSCESSPLDAYWPEWQNPLNSGDQREILELPVSVGFSRKNFELYEAIHKLISRPPFSYFRLVGFFWHLKLFRKLYLSPELCNAKEMNALVDVLLKRDQPVLHMYLHSSSLIDGVTGLVDAKGAISEICSRIQKVVEHLGERANLRFCTVSEARDILQARNSNQGVLR